MDDRDPFSTLRFPSAARPLLGLTVLLVEDSRYASDAVRLMCMRSGARIRRADCLRSARRHLQVYRPSVLMVDLGLPDGSGLDLIAEAVMTLPRIDLVLGISGDDGARDACLAAGANGFIAKPLRSIALFQAAILHHLPPDRQPSGPRAIPDDVISPDLIAYRDDIAHVADLLSDHTDAQILDYATRFLDGLAMLAGDEGLLCANRALRRTCQNGHDPQVDLGHLRLLLQDRMIDRVAI
jgi:CheY-like chemotaxis protein